MYRDCPFSAKQQSMLIELENHWTKPAKAKKTKSKPRPDMEEQMKKELDESRAAVDDGKKAPSMKDLRLSQIASGKATVQLAESQQVIAAAFKQATAKLSDLTWDQIKEKTAIKDEHVTKLKAAGFSVPLRLGMATRSKLRSVLAQEDDPENMNAGALILMIETEFKITLKD